MKLHIHKGGRTRTVDLRAIKARARVTRHGRTGDCACGGSEGGRDAGAAISFQKWMQMVEVELMRLHGLDPSDISTNWRAAHAKGRSVREAVDLAVAGRLRD